MDTVFKQISSYRNDWVGQRLSDCDFVLLLPSADIELNTQIRAAFERKLNGRSGVVVECQAVQGFIKLYELYEFNGKVIIGALDEPYGRKLFNLIDCGIADVETLINDVILGDL